MDSANFLERKSMEEMFADYAFGRLSPEAAADFERSLPQYPDLEQELVEVRAVFGRVARTAFTEQFDRETRNLSVNVLKRLENKGKVRRTLTRLLPAAALAAAAVAFVMLNRPPDAPYQWQTNQNFVLATDADYLTDQTAPDELAEAIAGIGEIHDEPAAPLSDSNASELVAAVATPVNSSLLTDDLLLELNDTDLDNLLENNNETSL